MMSNTDSNQWIDIGVNLSNKQFKSDQPQVLQDAKESGVESIILTGTSVKESTLALKQAQEYGLYSTAGIHPHDAKENSTDAFNKITSLAQDPKVVAIGETGLDFNRNFSTPEDQIASFQKHLELATQIQKPLFLHERDAADQMIDLLKEFKNDLPDAVIHCFTGVKEDLIRYLDLGLYIGITGWICDERRGFHLHELVKIIPSDRLMIETDAPYLLPRTLTPKPKNRRNEPKYLPHIGEYIANILNKPTQQFAEETNANTKRFFKLP